jgi:Zn-dependent protease with chaperone function
MSFPTSLRSPKELPLFTFGVVFSGIVWLLVLVSLIGAVYALFAAFVVFIVHSLFLANIRGNGLRVGPQQLPDLYARCTQAAQRLGLAEVPEIFVLQSGGLLNAFATKLFSRKFVILMSDLVDGCESEKQLDFVVGHEMGHLAAGHLAWASFLAPYRLMPWFGPAYSRACEYTCDRAGHAVTGDLQQSQRALLLLAGGRRSASQGNLGAFMAQSRETGGFFMAVHELVSTHPFLCKRAAALQDLEQGDTAAMPSRNPFAYPLAPFVGLSVGGASSFALIMLIYVGVLGALMAPIAAKSFARYTERAKSVAAQGAQTDEPPETDDEEP